jgi:hypothetical protein
MSAHHTFEEGAIVAHAVRCPPTLSPDPPGYRLQVGPTKGAPGRSHLGSMGMKD